MLFFRRVIHLNSFFRVPVAIKQLNEDLPPDEVMDLWKEASIMRNLQHRNIIQFYGIINERKVG